MRDRFFVDTNVLIYANDRSSPKKQRRAREIISDAFTDRRGCISTQILQEFFVAVTRKAGVPWSNAKAQVLRFAALDTVIVDRKLIANAIDLHHLDQISFWDALVVKSASAAGCSRIYTEDLNHGQTIDGVLIDNPFGS